MFGAGPCEISTKDGLTQSAMCFCECWIDLHRGRGCFVSCGCAFSKRHYAENTEPVVIGSDSGVRKRVLRIECDCLLVTNYGLRKTFFGKRVPVETTTQISFVRLRVFRAAFGQS